MKKRKGIILAGGSGTRLSPITDVVSKQLLPLYNKPMIYYPLSILMKTNIREVLVISTPYDLPQFQKLLGDGSSLGMIINFAIQPNPDGLAQALIIAKDFLDGSPSALVLGDNFFYGADLDEKLHSANINPKSTIFAYKVKDPERYGIVDFDNKKVLSVEEKPKKPKSNYAVVGLYFYDEHAPAYASLLNPSHRGELEITDLNNIYLKSKQLSLETLNDNTIWFDTGTFESLIESQNFIRSVQSRQGSEIACLEEIAYLNNWIDQQAIKLRIKKLGNNSYKSYLEKIIEK